MVIPVGAATNITFIKYDRGSKVYRLTVPWRPLLFVLLSCSTVIAVLVRVVFPIARPRKSLLHRLCLLHSVYRSGVYGCPSMRFLFIIYFFITKLQVGTLSLMRRLEVRDDDYHA